MVRVKRLAGRVTALHVRLAIVLAFAAAILLDLCIVYRAKAAHVAEHVSATVAPAYDMPESRRERQPASGG
jgi:hypothetical protein